MNDLPWWGYSNEYGWIVFDRFLPQNTWGGCMRTFFSCRDSSYFNLQIQAWEPSSYLTPNSFLNEIPENQKSNKKKEFDKAKIIYKSFKQVQKNEEEINLISKLRVKEKAEIARKIDADQKINRILFNKLELVREKEEREVQGAARVVILTAEREFKEITLEAEKIKILNIICNGKLPFPEWELWAKKYKIRYKSLIDDLNKPTFIFEILRRLRNGIYPTQIDLKSLRESDCFFLAAKVHWWLWKTNLEPWYAVHACSLYRKARQPEATITLMGRLNTFGWNNRPHGALLTSVGAAYRDIGELDKAWIFALNAVDIAPEAYQAYMLLGAICYQKEAYIDGENYFTKAMDLGASTRQIEYEKENAENYRLEALMV